MFFEIFLDILILVQMLSHCDIQNIVKKHCIFNLILSELVFSTIFEIIFVSLSPNGIPSMLIRKGLSNQLKLIENYGLSFGGIGRI